MPEELDKVVESARLKFSKAVREYRAAHGSYIDYAQPIPQQLLDECKVFTDRLTMLSSGVLPSSLIWAEVGVDKAEFSAEIIKRCSPSKLYLIDIDTNRIDPDNIESPLAAGMIEIHEGDSSTIMQSFPDDYFDVIYIDGDHYYEGVKKDVVAAYSKIKQGGHIVFNDYASWSPGFMYKCGVAKAANELIVETHSDVVAIALQGSGYHDLAIRVNKSH